MEIVQDFIGNECKKNKNQEVRVDKDKIQEQTTIRLTIRAPEELEKLIRDEAVRRGTNVNQTMLYILNRHFKN